MIIVWERGPPGASYPPISVRTVMHEGELYDGDFSVPGQKPWNTIPKSVKERVHELFDAAIEQAKKP
jgi:hypothetical protein